MSQLIAIFPIPGLVAFPGQTIPLHIFEPRYRQMVEDSLEQGFEVGLCPPQGVISKADERVSPLDEQRIQKNLTIFEHPNIMGCGELELMERLEDGRYLVNIHIAKKVEVLNVEKERPYVMANVSLREEKIGEPYLAQQAYDKLMELLFAIIGKRKEVLDQLKFERGELSQLILDLVTFIHLPDHTRQAILEEDCIENKAEIIMLALAGGPKKSGDSTH